MRNLAIAILTALPMCLSQAQAQPFENFFDYEEPRPPVGGDCGEISAAIGREATWYGQFAGNRFDIFNDRYYPYSAQGCFDSEIACRIWQNRAITYLVDGAIVATSCRRGRG